MFGLLKHKTGPSQRQHPLHFGLGGLVFHQLPDSNTVTWQNLWIPLQSHDPVKNAWVYDTGMINAVEQFLNPDDGESIFGYVRADSP